MATGGCPPGRRPMRIVETELLGASAARRTARRRRQLALEAGLRRSAGSRGPAAPGSWQDREQAARPALQAAVAGVRVSGIRRYRRNAAWHAAGVPAAGFARATASALAEVVAGPRRGACARGGGGGQAAEGEQEQRARGPSGDGWGAPQEPSIKVVQGAELEAQLHAGRDDVEDAAAEAAGADPAQPAASHI
ncbi:unnamed protein product [Prorocentrum cordatum]|uniref:Uncharacterized protein n=1 Tax=Prorocentrum cordatum TaxID=2364126 RepID=A0ABN9RUQ6_9DINO|nr:unnamed protein product [Polarella glacialis]